MSMPNHGLILGPIIPSSLLLGANLPIRRPDGRWSDYLPMYEPQSKFGWDSMNCVQCSFCNCLECIAKSYGVTYNRSDRFLHWASNCAPNGNTYSNCLEGFERHGAPDELKWPWLTPMTYDEYHKQPPDDVRMEASQLFTEWEFGGVTYVPPTVAAFREALKRSPIWFWNNEHSMMMYAIDDRLRIFDTYGADGKLDLPLSYMSQIYGGYMIDFKPKKTAPLPSMTFEENTKYFNADPPGRWFLYAKGRMYYDELAKINSMWELRSAKRLEGGKLEFVGGKMGIIQDKDLQGVQLYNLKDEPTKL